MSEGQRKHRYACVRCVKHKKRCDPAPGACLNCLNAQAKCSKAGSAEASSLSERCLIEPLQRAIQHLKDEVASYDDITSPSLRRHERLHSLNSEAASAVNAIQHGRAYSPALQIASQLWQSMPDGVVRNTQHHAYLGSLLGGAELPFPLTLRSKVANNPPRQSQGTVKISSLLPRDVTKKLLYVYIERILPQCPIFSPMEVNSIYNRVYNGPLEDEREGNIVQKGDSFIMSMIMAIATMTSNSDNYAKVVDVTDSLYKEALQSDNNGEILVTTSIRSLQGLLLLAQYGLFMPQAVDLWHTVSEAMRIAIELGLHRESADISNVDCETAQAQRRLFWATYSMERTVSLTCHRHLAIRDDQIMLKMSNENLTWGNESTVTRYNTHLAFCRLQVEISSVNICREPFPHPSLTWAEWAESCEQRIEALRSNSWTEAIMIPDWLDIPASRCLAWLYMPCPKNPSPSDDTMTKFVQTLMRMLQMYWTLAPKKSLKLCWYAAHHTYEIGTQLLFCMQNYPHIVEACCDKIALLDALTHLSDFLIEVEERWPASVQCRTLLAQLKKDIIEVFMQRRPTDGVIIEQQSGEQRIVDVIFRRNGYFFFAADELFNIQSELERSFAGNSFNVVPQFPSTESDALADSLDLYNTHFMDSNSFDDPLLDWFVDTSTDGTGLAVAAIADTTDSSVPPQDASIGIESIAHSVEAQNLVHIASQSLSDLRACKLCKSKRIKCSRTLPSCHNCVDFGKDCLYVEQSTGRWIAGSYLHELQQEMRSLMSILEKHRTTPNNGTLEQIGNFQRQGLQEVSTTLSLTYDSSYGSSSRYFGETSILGKLLSAPPLPGVVQVMSVNRTCRLPSTAPSMSHELLLRSVHELSRDFLESLARGYLDEVETFYPVLGKALISDMIGDIHERPSMSTGSLRHDPAHSEAILCLMVAISLAIPFEARSTSLQISTVYFERALALQSSRTNSLFSNSTVTSLQFQLLLCLYVWFDPSAGNLSRLVNAACRMCLDLLESQDLKPEETATVHILFRTAYILDTIVAVAYGRPNYLPEWKNLESMVVNTGTLDGRSDDADGNNLSFMVYNLARLRSTIHQDILSHVDSGVSGQDYILSTPKVLSLKAQIDEWWNHWEQQTSYLMQPQDNGTGLGAGTSTSDGVLQTETKAYCYGVILHAGATTLLRTLAEKSGAALSDGGVPLSSAEVLIKVYGALKGGLSPPSSLHRGHLDSIPTSGGRVIEAGPGFPVCWTDYADLMGAGLELLMADSDQERVDVATQMLDLEPERRRALLEKCHGLLVWLEAAIGNPDWTLARALEALMSASFS